MNYMQLLVLSQRETGAVMLHEDNSLRYTIDNVRGQATTVAVSWPSAQFDEAWFTSFLPTKWKSGSGLIESLTFDISEGDLVVSEDFSAYAADTYIISAHPDDDYRLFGMADLEAEAARFSRDILKETLNNILGLLESGHVYHFLDDAVQIVKRVSAKPEWVQGIETAGPQQPTTEGLAGLIRILKSLLSEGDFWQIDTAFRTMNMSRVSVESLIVLLRTTYHRRSSLETWRAFLDSAKKEISKRGLSAQEVFFGLG